jgi:uncharacterized protein with HEPN domain
MEDYTMTMMSPESYADDIKDLPYEKLVDIRNELIEELHKIEKSGTAYYKIHDEGYTDVIYQMTNHYLVEVTKLLNEKYNQIVWRERQQVKGIIL